jgi:signal transduction histidine kinase/ligand-binding sensor domain-containing protein
VAIAIDDLVFLLTFGRTSCRFSRTMRTGHHTRLLLMLALLSAPAAPGQLLPLRSYTTKDGLISNAVTAVLQDSRGYLWIGTNEGLSVYDGATFANSTTVEGLSNNYVTSLMESKRRPGTIWIGTTQRGLTRWRDGSFSRIAVGTTQLTNNISSLDEDTSGTLWCGTSDGVFRVQGDSARPFVLDVPFSGGAVVAATPQGTIWTGSGHTVIVFTTDGRCVSTPPLAMKPGEFIDWITSDEDGEVWIGTTGNVVKLFSDTTLVAEHRFEHHVNGLLRDRSGSMWFGTSGEILRGSKEGFRQGTFMRYGMECGFPEKATWLALEDNEQNLWFATSNNGLLKLSERALQRFPIRALTRNTTLDSSGHLWMPANGGVWEAWKAHDDQYRTRFHQTPQRRDDEPGGPAAFDQEGRLWMSSAGVIFRCYRTGDPTGDGQLQLVQTIGPVRSLPQGMPLSMIIDHEDRLICSVEGAGLVIVDLHATARPPVVLSSQHDFPLTSVRSIYQDRGGSTWLGGYNDGVVQLRFDVTGVPAVVRHFTMKDGLPDDGVRAFAEDEAGRLWIGTRFGGVAIYNGRGFDTLSTRDGILSNAIWSITRDRTGRMWLGTSSGLMVVNPDSIHDFSWTAETAGEGVDFAAATRDGVVWFGSGLVSVAAYEPEKHTPVRVPPPISITALAVNDSAASLQDPLELRHDQNSIAIQYAGISFMDERSVRYQYRLNDAAWSRPSGNRSVSFAAMSPGRYTFEVRAINRNGLASARPAAISFLIVPPFWERWWFLSLVGLAILGALALLYRYRVSHLLEIERLRVRIAGDLHDDVGTNLSSILVTSQIMEREGQLTEQDRLQLREIATVASTTQEMMRDIVWMLNPANDSLDDLLLKMKETAAKLLGSLEYSFSAPPEKLTEKVSIEFKRNTFLMFKEALNNILRHSQASHADITVRHDDAGFTLRIHDNGRGFDPEQRGSGMGLTNLRRRAAQIGGILTIDTSPGRGTTISLVVENHANT